MKALRFPILAAAFALLGLSTYAPAIAQSTPLPSAYICNACTGSLAVTSTSARVALPSTSPPYGTLTVYNSGSKTAYFVQGDVTAVATTSAIPVASGAYVTLNVNGTYLAAITGGADTTTLTIYQSNGLIEFGNGSSASSGGGGGPATIADGADVAEGARADTACTDTTSSWTVIALQKCIAAAVRTLATASSSNVTQLASTPTTATLQNAAVANGNGATLSVNGMSSAVLTVNCATCSGGTTVNFEGTEDGTNYFALSATQLGTTTIATSTTTAGLTAWQMPVAGLQLVRARISAYSAGTVTVTGHTVPVDYNSRVVNANVSAGQRTIVALDVSTVTTGGTAVTSLTAGHRTAGGFLQNPPNATINLCINEQGTASGTTSAGATTCIVPGQSYNITPAAGAVSVISSDSAHPFSGYGLN